MRVMWAWAMSATSLAHVSQYLRSPTFCDDPGVHRVAEVVEAEVQRAAARSAATAGSLGSRSAVVGVSTRGAG